MDRALVIPYTRNITLITRFAIETNFFVFVLFVYLSFSLELPHTTTTKVTPESEYHMINYGDLGGCYPPRRTVSTDNTLLDLHNSS